MFSTIPVAAPVKGGAIPPGRHPVSGHGFVGMDVRGKRRRQPPLWRRKRGIRVDPKTLLRNALERLTRRYTSELGVIIGPTTPETDAFEAVWQVAQEHKVSLRTATFIIACKRILHARELRGLYP